MPNTTLQPTSLLDCIIHSTGRIIDRYFLINHETGLYKERVYAYELYHQIRNVIPDDSCIQVNGEFQKGHEFKGEFNRKSPDILFHEIGNTNPTTLYAVLEIKHTGNQAIKKDLEKLNRFKKYGYQNVIFLFYGSEYNSFERLIVEILSEGNITKEIIFLYHGEAGKPAENVTNKILEKLRVAESESSQVDNSEEET